MRSGRTSCRTYSRPMPREAPTTAYEGIAVRKDRVGDEVEGRERWSEMGCGRRAAGELQTEN